VQLRPAEAAAPRVDDAGAAFSCQPILPGPEHSRSSRHRGAAQKREDAMSINEITQLITALAGLVLAFAKLVRVWRGPL
jgi:hypothetical protein